MQTSDDFEMIGDVKCPVIYVTRDTHLGFCKFWCKYCDKWHRHGMGDGHRSAHCTNNSSPYLKTGYILKTKEGYFAFAQDIEYTIHLYNFKDNKKESYKINREQVISNQENIIQLIQSYESRDYSTTTLCALKLFNKISNDGNEGILIDLQSEGDGMPDFMFEKFNEEKKLNPSFEDFYIEFKSESDSLRLNQLYSFLTLSQHFNVYLLHIDKRRFK